MQTKLKLFIRIISFILLGLLIGGKLQSVLLAKFGYPNTGLSENNDRILSGFYSEQKGKINVVSLGVSHMAYGFSPMELYENYGIYSYNLASAAQPLPLSYYMLMETFYTQSPELILLDVTSLYYDEKIDNYRDACWRYALNNMRLGETKIQAAIELSKNNDEVDVLNVIFPIFRYHDRWKELKNCDFDNFINNERYYSKGYNLVTSKESTWAQDVLLEEEKHINCDNEKIVECYVNDELYSTAEYDPLYETSIDNSAIYWLKKIDLLCQANDAELLLVKIPTYGSMIYKNPWTRQKSKQVKDLAKENDFDFLDLMYDCDAGIDWSKDSSDGGSHLNLLGAEKISNIIGKYIIEHYGLQLVTNLKDEMWDYELDLYNQLKKVAKLQLECDLPSYINMLRENFNDKTIFFMANYDMTTGLMEDARVALKEIGLHTDFENAYEKSYAAVIDNGKNTYECLSNRVIFYNGETKNGKKYTLESAGRYVRNRAGLYFDDDTINYAINNCGINIVVYDDKLDMILDRVCFCTDIFNYSAIRNNNYSWKDFRKYEIFMMDGTIQ